MFPQFDPAMIRSVLTSVNEDTDEAVSVLLSMVAPQHRERGRVQAAAPLDASRQVAARARRQVSTAAADGGREDEAETIDLTDDGEPAAAVAADDSAAAAVSALIPFAIPAVADLLNHQGGVGF